VSTDGVTKGLQGVASGPVDDMSLDHMTTPTTNMAIIVVFWGMTV